jgi:hypothetical protein
MALCQQFGHLAAGAAHPSPVHKDFIKNSVLNASEVEFYQT